ncbi:MAG: hypothetical protein P4M08_06440 [Oligoflexia bacterium]|nr:hypothetical protein [Oligoflexia bacterium]
MLTRTSQILIAFIALIGLAGSARAENANSTQDFSIEDDRSLEEIAMDELKALPNFGIQLRGSMSAFGSGISSAYTQGVHSQAAVLEAEFQPAALQNIGVIGIGPSVGVYPTTGTFSGTGMSPTTGYFSLWEAGGQIRYQAKYWPDQIVVPFVAYEMQLLNYSLINGPTNRLTLTGGSLGLSLLLNRFDPQQALALYKSTNISRSYFFIEGNHLAGSDSTLSIGGASFFFGLRCEL